MRLVRQPDGSKNYNLLDPDRARMREQLRQRAVRDATKATDAVRVSFRRDLKAARLNDNEGSSATDGREH